MRHLSRLAAVVTAVGLLAAATPAHAAGPVLFTERTAQKPPVDAVPIVADFNSDGVDDILWYATGSKTDRLWYGRADGNFVGQAISVGGNFEPLVGDWDGDGHPDILWYAAGPGADYLWFGTGVVSAMPFTSRAITIGGTYRPLIDDYDGDGFTDILWYAPGPAGDAFWYGQASRTFASRPVSISGVYDYVSGGDFDGDGIDDILWWKATATSHPLWESTGTRGTYSASRLTGPAAGSLPLVMNIDGDTLADVVWYGSGSVADALMLGSAPTTLVAKSISGVYEPLWGNFDGDNAVNDDGSYGRDDIVWWNQAPSGADAFWRGGTVAPWFTASGLGNTHVDWATHYPTLGSFDAGETLDLQFNDPYLPASNPFWYGIDADGVRLARQQARAVHSARPFAVTGAVCGAVAARGLSKICAAARS